MNYFLSRTGVAIVIGNNNYYEPYKLNNAVNDATSMADVFYRLGYTVVSEYDCDNKKYEGYCFFECV